MATQFTLQKVLDQIAANKEKLKFPTPSEGGSSDGRSGGELSSSSAEPVSKVQELFNEGDLEKRRKELDDKKREERYESAFDSAGRNEEEGPTYPTHTPLESLPSSIREGLLGEKEIYEIRSVFDLKDLFLTFRDKFDDLQKGALDSVVRVCDTIEVGCKCKKGARLRIAEDYYVKFITENQHNGLIEKIKETLNTKKIIFYTKDTIFLER